MSFIKPKRKKRKRKLNWEDLDREGLETIEKRYSIAVGHLLLEEIKRDNKMARKSLRLSKKREKKGLKYIG